MYERKIILAQQQKQLLFVNQTKRTQYDYLKHKTFITSHSDFNFKVNLRVSGSKIYLCERNRLDV